MKRSLLTTTCVVTQILVTSILSITIVNLSASAKGPSECELNPTLYSLDCDGNQSVDVGDAVCLLNYLFVPGSMSPQVCLAQSASLTPEELMLLREILPHLSVESLDDGQGGVARTIRFTGVNVQIVNGSGATNSNPMAPNDVLAGKTNGVGNLIVGYNEGSPPHDDRTGSHNIVQGTNNNYTSFGGFVAGARNTISGAYSSVTAGWGNVAGGAFSSVTGGAGNEATGHLSSVAGGDGNEATGEKSVVCGGLFNESRGLLSVVSGGNQNLADASAASVSGGTLNIASGQASSVSGGGSNRAVAGASTVSGGTGNLAEGLGSSVSGGEARSASGESDWAAGSLIEDN